MKWYVTIAIITSIFATCRKATDNEATRGKVVHRSCATVVVQVLDSNHHHLGQATWQQSPSKPLFNHVFAVENICEFPGTIGEGDEFSFQIINPNSARKDCAVCMLWDNPPTTKQVVKVLDVK